MSDFLESISAPLWCDVRGIAELLLRHLLARFLKMLAARFSRKANGVSSNCFGSKKVFHFTVRSGRGAVVKGDYPNNLITNCLCTHKSINF